MRTEKFLVSVHLRKCGGTTFSTSLQKHYGTRLLLDYGDELGSSWPSSVRKRSASLLQVNHERDHIETCFDAVHGHFDPRKYSCIRGEKQLISFVRNPIQRVLSNYFYLKRTVIREHPDHYVVGKLGFTLEEYVRYPDARNVQSKGLGPRAINTYAFLGLTERMKTSLLELNSQLGLSLLLSDDENVNPSADREYDISDRMKKLIRKNNRQDLSLYGSVEARFS